MTLHTFIEYIKYRWKAKGRHGTHSPFVYQLVESGLQRRGSQPLQQFLKNYFGDDLQLVAAPVEQWRRLALPANNTAVVAIKNIHASWHSTNEWNFLKNESNAMMSIDLFEYGLLLFRQDFLEKQHFVIKT